MMAGGDWAVFAKAKWLREGGHQAFIKFIVPAGSHAGPKTDLITGGGRLARLASRLVHIKAQGDDLPVVRLLEVSLSSSGLLVAMEEVTPLKDLIDQGEAYQHSVRLLRDLDPFGARLPWMHFDICPKNIGITATGKAVLIDLESLYLKSSGAYDISVPAWKPFRAPPTLVNDVEVGLATGALGSELAMRKVRFEVALAAAECVLGPLPPHRSAFDASQAQAWLADADPGDPAVAFWRTEVDQLVTTGDIRALSELARDLEALLVGHADAAVAPRAWRTARGDGTSEPQPGAGSLASRPAGGWDLEWNLLVPTAHALRAGRLDREGIREYGVVLDDLALRYPDRHEIWDELLLVRICYQKDPNAALVHVNTALSHLNGDARLTRTQGILKMWASEKDRRRGE